MTTGTGNRCHWIFCEVEHVVKHEKGKTKRGSVDFLLDGFSFGMCLDLVFVSIFDVAHVQGLETNQLGAKILEHVWKNQQTKRSSTLALLQS